MIKNIIAFAYTKSLFVLGGLLLAGSFLLMPLPVAQAISNQGVVAQAATCRDIQSAADKKNNSDVDGSACIYQKYLNPLIRFVSAITGIIATISIVVAGIQYSTAGGDSGKVAAAKKRISQAIIAFLIFLFFLSFLQFLIPGGITGRG